MLVTFDFATNRRMRRYWSRCGSSEETLMNTVDQSPSRKGSLLSELVPSTEIDTVYEARQYVSRRNAMQASRAVGVLAVKRIDEPQGQGLLIGDTEWTIQIYSILSSHTGRSGEPYPAMKGSRGFGPSFRQWTRCPER